MPFYFHFSDGQSWFVALTGSVAYRPSAVYPNAASEQLPEPCQVDIRRVGGWEVERCSLRVLLMGTSAGTAFLVGILAPLAL